MKRLVTGYQASGELTIGNYLGSIQNLIEIQDEYESFVFIANLHSITLPQEKLAFKRNQISIAKMLIACGLDVSKSTLYVQSDVLEIPLLSWILTCNTSMDELKKMTQFKTKKSKGVKMDNNTTTIPTGLFVYPPLMAADILAFQANVVPVGQDQTQHLELASTLAKRMNTRYGDMFEIPKGYFKKTSSRIMSLQDVNKKMSKSSDNSKSYILLSDIPATARKKIMSSVTDCDGIVYYDKENKPGISNLIEIYAGLEKLTIEDAETKLKQYDYKKLKVTVANSVVRLLEDIQEKYNSIDDKDLIDILEKGAKKASKIAKKTLTKVCNKTGVNYVKK